MRTMLLLLATACLLACPNTINAQPTASAVVVTVDYRAQPGNGDALHAALQPLLAEVRKEPHFLGITVLRDAQDDSDRILLVERWADQAYYTGAHGNSPHLEAFKAMAMPLLAGPPLVMVWSGVEEVAKP
ncbi:MAG: antibiotic biosynthesis monooxygenase [Flavobacteriales bacterium]|nr:antibiotic biosynthesis monooxygenase [Flavobacteriales bacterium]